MAAPAGVEFDKPCCLRAIDGRVEVVSRECRHFIVGIIQRDRLFRGWSVSKKTEKNQKDQIHIFTKEERFHRSGIIKWVWVEKDGWKSRLCYAIAPSKEKPVLEITVLHRTMSLRSYWPVKLGFRFSKNAVMPSLRSAYQHNGMRDHTGEGTYQAKRRMEDTFFVSISFRECCFEG